MVGCNRGSSKMIQQFQPLESLVRNFGPVKSAGTLTQLPGTSDSSQVRVFFAILCCTTLARADSHPAWWTLASPEATALVGIQWEYVRSSPFGEAVRAELSGSGSLGFPDLHCIQDARQILISSPALLAIAVGDFPAATLRREALAEGMKSASYRGIPLWIASGDTLSLALMNEATLLVGDRKTLESAIDRGMSAGRNYSPLLPRAARFSHDDLWVVSTQLPDPLASVFVPLDTDARGFDGGISLRDGLRLDATLQSGSEDAAAFAADAIAKSLPTLPSIARGIEVTPEADHVVLTLDVSRDEFAASLRQAPSTAPPAASAAPGPSAPPEPPKPAAPQIIHIYGLDDGPREIILPPVKQPQQK